MIQAFWFLVKTGAVVALAVLVMNQPGALEITWQDYTLKAQLGFVLLALMAAVLALIFVVRSIDSILYWPRFWMLSRRQRRQEKGLRVLTRGLAAVAAGDGKAAAHAVRRAGKFLPAQAPLRLLLAAQTAQLQGDEQSALRLFEKLSADKDGGFLGLRGQIQIALGRDDISQARMLAQKALTRARHGQWALQSAYDLALRTRRWQEALALLPRLHGKDSAQAIGLRRALLIAQGDDFLAQGYQAQALGFFKAAWRLDQEFVPAALRLAQLYRLIGRPQAARAVVLKCWRRHAHPELATLWHDLMPPHKAAKGSPRLQWMKRLVDLAPAQAEGYLALAREAQAQALWGLARGYYMKAEQLGPDQRLYAALASLEVQSGNSAAAGSWLEKQRDSAPAGVWICAQTGRIYPQWQPVAEPHGAFNSILWGLPEMAQTLRLAASA
ncbi:MAG: hypothetical protein L6Q57_01605 [Alphaproteobacteria bacterium]|nr:hypothetical protein [Alphaproteobacteria bacterium]